MLFPYAKIHHYWEAPSSNRTFSPNKNSESRRKNVFVPVAPVTIFNSMGKIPPLPPQNNDSKNGNGTAHSFKKFPEKPGRKSANVFLFLLFQIISTEMT